MDEEAEAEPPLEPAWPDVIKVSSRAKHCVTALKREKSSLRLSTAGVLAGIPR
jgi:hypothetical protein